ncbi:MAG: phosphoribosylformimino-5-aminoimidazole carboxamide ribotide isomerase [Huintestinicola sp.]|uniref:phosphoribosylformimino-5-aminoimidazole carboxamide ribotide isomerase n=1 Tax=Huintestinicola sp. TaxID=2981661 RepID=UPI003F04C6D2
MKFRPCIDIHNGCVKQIVGGSLADKNSHADENFVSEQGGDLYARLYKSRGLSGGHVIILNPAGSEYYEADRRQAFAALAEFPGGMQIGGGVNDENASEYLEKGASHVIVTSYVFKDGSISFERLDRLKSAVGAEHIVLDLSCRKRDGKYFIVTDRWQKFTDMEVTRENILMLKGYCDEFLVHAVDAEGKQKGIEEGIASLLGNTEGIVSTYAGGIGSYEDIELLRALGKGNVDFTVGSALDIFGGRLSFERIAEMN